MLEQKQKNAGFKNRDAFIRKMLFTGYIVKIDFEPINELVSLTAHLSNNVNQLAKKANSYEAITSEEIQALRELTQSINDTNKELLEKIGKL